MTSFRLRSVWIGVMLAALATIGCDDSASSDGSDMDSLAAQLEQSKQAQADAAAQAKEAAQQAAAEAAQRDAERAAPSAAEQARAESTEFNARSGRRGQSFHGQGGYLNAVFSARFTSENQITKAQMKKNLDLFEATNSRYPSSQEEYFQAIIVDGGVSLPELNPGEEYWYDVENHQLMVRTPTGEGEALGPP